MPPINVPYFFSSTQVAHNALKPVKRLFWRSVQTLIRKQFSLEGDMVPQVPLPQVGHPSAP